MWVKKVMGENLALVWRLPLSRIYGCEMSLGCGIISVPQNAGEAQWQSTLPRRTSRSLSLVTCSIFHWQLTPVAILSRRTFLNPKALSGCISLPKDEYEDIASLHLLGCAGCYGHGPARAASASSPSGFGVGNGQRLARSGSGGQNPSTDREKLKDHHGIVIDGDKDEDVDVRKDMAISENEWPFQSSRSFS